MLATATPILAVTDVGSISITSDTTWNSEGSPYVVQSLTVNAGVTLTVEAGTVTLR